MLSLSFEKPDDEFEKSAVKERVGIVVRYFKNIIKVSTGGTFLQFHSFFPRGDSTRLKCSKKMCRLLFHYYLETLGKIHSKQLTN